MSSTPVPLKNSVPSNEEHLPRSPIHPVAHQSKGFSKQAPTPDIAVHTKGEWEGLDASKGCKPSDDLAVHTKGREGEGGITHEELLQSYADQLTQVASKSPAPAADKSRDKDAKKVKQFWPTNGQQGRSTWIASVYALFRVHLRHMATVLVTAIVVLLACSLRGKEINLNKKKKEL